MKNILNEKEVLVSLSNNCLHYSKKAPYFPDQIYPEYPFSEAITDKTNCVYKNLRQLFFQMGLDIQNFNTKNWNPLSFLIKPGNVVLLKPNFVTHYNWGYKSGLTDTLSLITHGSIIRAILDYVIIALNGNGKIIIGDAPLQSADFEEIKNMSGLTEIVNFYKKYEIDIEIVDFRLRKALLDKDNEFIDHINLKGDYKGYFAIDLGKDSLLIPLINDYKKFRVSGYNPKEMFRHHNKKVNEYIIPKTVFESDVFINIPKLKTHVKAGITVSLKNLVGINGHKDWLAHYRKGASYTGGDEYYKFSLFKAVWLFFEQLEWSTNKKNLRSIYKLIKKIFRFLTIKFWDDGFYQGGWYGNDTLWRTTLDINRILFYTNKKGELTNKIQRKYISIIDGVIAGEKEGPLQPSPKECGVIIIGQNPVATDVVAATIMGFDYKKIPTIEKAFKIKKYPLVNFKSDEIIININNKKLKLQEIYNSNYLKNFVPGKGWIGHIELKINEKI